MNTAVKDTIGRTVVGLHRTIYRASGGRLLNGMGGMPVLQLTTTGRKSGEKRTSMLTVPLHHEGHPVVVASRGGDDRPPSWYLNLKANPEVTVEFKGTTGPAQARVATDAERETLWPKVVASYKGYGEYQKKTDRVIPLVILES
jgi:deazaflavin-dependent oxidoreductase (nitroreductase family)